jgi:NAD(P)-dependent dehydrogenase (short-subunit alcohol dehydrogenase family)
MDRVKGQVAIVTGGAKGIGKAAALALAREGAAVVIADVDELTAQLTAEEIRSAGGEVTIQRTDVSVSSDVAALVDATVARYGGLHVLVNNAGIAVAGSVTDLTEQDWERVLNTNLTGIWRGMKYGIPAMIRGGGGSIINISSVQSLVGFPGWAGYAASKGGINALTQQAAVEYAPRNIRVNAIAPGTIWTPMNQRIVEATENPQTLIDDWNRRHALGRFGQPEEVAALILFLASAESSFITGECIRIDGGMTINGR